MHARLLLRTGGAGHALHCSTALWESLSASRTGDEVSTRSPPSYRHTLIYAHTLRPSPPPYAHTLIPSALCSLTTFVPSHAHTLCGTPPSCAHTLRGTPLRPALQARSRRLRTLSVHPPCTLRGPHPPRAPSVHPPWEPTPPSMPGWQTLGPHTHTPSYPTASLQVLSPLACAFYNNEEMTYAQLLLQAAPLAPATAT
jgi:hypothetical protein